MVSMIGLYKDYVTLSITCNVNCYEKYCVASITHAFPLRVFECKSAITFS